ncbi:MAG: methionyl-tRNA formyltransferase [bacterium]|nr:methionyl-tRNA formyltransferase [bacterium]MDD5353977.1 methionyl-tRNA formyltransferase [bacterium]MDD5756050.1 methionyl-tRNA formyltransferase [bacterium]
MRVIFMGTPRYAVPFLQSLLDMGEDIVGVVTMPDKPVGRKQEIQEPPVKVLAQKKNIPVFQPAKINETSSLEALKNLNPDLAVVVGFGQILSQKLLDLPKQGTINVHFSLLPKYRGASPIQAAIINGEEKTGISTMFLVRKLDSGPVLLQREVPIDQKDTSVTLTEKLTKVGVEVLQETVALIRQGKAEAKPQEEARSSYAALLVKESGLIDWQKNSRELYNFVRGLYPWPGAYTFYTHSGKKHMLKIWEAEEIHRIELNHNEAVSGTILDVLKNHGFAIKCGQGGLLLTKVQSEGGKVMPAYNFVIGHHLKKGDILGK